MRISPVWQLLTTTALWVAAALVMSAGCGDVPDSLGNSFAVEITPGSWVEAEFAMAAGDTIEADFDSGGVALVWNVHSHVASTAIDHLTGTSDGEVISFEAPETRLYWVMWTNLSERDATLDVGFRYGGSAAFNGWYP